MDLSNITINSVSSICTKEDGEVSRHRSIQKATEQHRQWLTERKKQKWIAEYLPTVFVARRRLLLVLMVVTISKNLSLCNARGRTRRNGGKHGRIDV
jgi:RAB protein geranylgeranyltransferase component A